MSHRKEKFITGDNYHVTIRAIDDNLVFKDTDDYFRGIFSIYEFNDTNPVTIQAKRKARRAFKNSLKKLEKIDRRPTSIYSKNKVLYCAIFFLCSIQSLMTDLNPSGPPIIVNKNSLSVTDGKFFFPI